MKNNDIKFGVSAFNNKEIIYGSTLLDTASVETILAINDEFFSAKTEFQLNATVDANDVYLSPLFKIKDLDRYLDEAELAVEAVIE